MKIAIVGTGIAGNVVAHNLSRNHDITVFEANDYVGGHTNTVTVPAKDGTLNLDTGFIVFNDRTYPNFIQLLDSLGVDSQESSMTFSVQCERTSIEYNGASLNTLFAQRRNLLRPRFYRMIRDILRFNREATTLLDSDQPHVSLADYLETNNYSQDFIQQYLVPMGAAIWSAEPDMMGRMPANFFVRFFDNHGLLSLKDRPTWRVIDGGSSAYVEKLIAGHKDKIRLNTPVQSVRRRSNKVTVTSRDSGPEEFDSVFLACHSDQALGLLQDPTSDEQEILGSIPYQENEAILHTDASLMPKRERAWAAWNYLVSPNERSRATVTYHLNRLQNLRSSTQYFVTLNSEERIRPESIIKRVAYDHPVFTASSVAAQKRQHEVNGVNRTYYCGAYWRNGFHEDGVVSALAALDHFNERNDNAQRYFQRAS